MIFSGLRKQTVLDANLNFRYRFASPSATYPYATTLEREKQRGMAVGITFVSETPNVCMVIKDEDGKEHTLHWREDMQLYQC